MATVEAGPDAPELDRLRHYFNHPGFVAANADALVDAVQSLPAAARAAARVAFVTHSIPTAMNAASGPGGGAYVAQHEVTATEVARAASSRLGKEVAWDLVYCSRSGSPDVPWLQPDVNDHLATLAGADVPAVVLAPIGFVSDHMEVVFDLDTEAVQTASDLA